MPRSRLFGPLSLYFPLSPSYALGSHFLYVVLCGQKEMASPYYGHFFVFSKEHFFYKSLLLFKLQKLYFFVEFAF